MVQRTMFDKNRFPAVSSPL